MLLPQDSVRASRFEQTAPCRHQPQYYASSFSISNSNDGTLHKEKQRHPLNMCCHESVVRPRSACSSGLGQYKSLAL